MQKFKKFLLTVLFVFAVFLAPGAVKATTPIQDQINALMQQIAALQAQLAQLQAQQGTTQAWCHTFNTNLRIGDSSNEVMALQEALRKEGFFTTEIYSTFDDPTASAVVGFQEKYATEILTRYGLTHGTGFVGVSTRAKLNALYGCQSSNLPPVISGVSGPSTLNVGQAGTWTINASDPENGTLKYNVRWGDVESGLGVDTQNQTATFSHSYSLAGNYTVKFYVYDNAGNTAASSITVNVGNTTQPSITVKDSPSGSVVAGSTVQISWISTGNIANVGIGFCPKGETVNGSHCTEGRLFSNTGIAYVPLTGALNLSLGQWYPVVRDTTFFSSAYGVGGVFTVIATTTQPSVNVTSPSGGEQWAQGSTQTITWTGGQNTDGSYNGFDVRLLSAACVNTNQGTSVYNNDTNISVTCNLPGAFLLISLNVLSNSYQWQVGKITQSNYLINPGNYYIEVCKSNSTICDRSNSYFSIVAPTSRITAASVALIGNQLSYVAGQTIQFSVRGTASDGSNGSPDKGFNVQYRLIDGTNGDSAIQVNGVYQAGNAVYNYSTGNWDVTMTAPFDASKTYIAKSMYYCSTYTTINGANPNSVCAEGQIDKSFTFTIGSTQPSIISFTRNNSTDGGYDFYWNTSGGDSTEFQVPCYSGLKITTHEGDFECGDVTRNLAASRSYHLHFSNNSGAAINVRVILAVIKSGIRVVTKELNINIPNVSTSQPSITVTRPDSTHYNSWQAGNTMTISWTSSNITGNVNLILLDPRAGWSYHMIATNVPVSQGSYQWTIPISGGWFSNPFTFTTTGSYPFVIRVTPYTPTLTNANGEGDWVPLQSAADAIVHGDSQSFGITAPATLAVPTGVIIYAGAYTGANTQVSPGPIVTVPAGTTLVSLTWASTNATSCNIVGSPVNVGNGNNLGPSNSYVNQFVVDARNNNTYTLTCSNSAGSSSNSITVNIAPAITTPSITVTSPNGGEQWVQGSTKTITWTGGQNSNGTYSGVDIKLSTNHCVNMGTSCTLAEQIFTITSGALVSSSYSWQVGKVYGSNTLVQPGNYSVQVCVTNTDICDKSDSYFSIGYAQLSFK